MFNFEMAHALKGYNGPCRHIHGHSYKLLVTLIGEPENNPESPNNGMLIDFSVLKNIVREQIIDVFDHALLLNIASKNDFSQKEENLFTKTIFTDYQPTCENLLTDFVQRIIHKIPSQVRLHNLKLYETSTSFAEWYADDNA